MKHHIWLIGLLLPLACSTPPKNQATGVIPKAPGIKPTGSANLAAVFGETEGTFVFYDLNNNRYIRHNSTRAAQRFSPCSTFKIPNSLIALETGAVADADSVIEWDSKKYPKKPGWDTHLAPWGIHWDRDHSLKSAFAQSCVWYYQELAQCIGSEKMARYLEKFVYGNNDISGGIDRFWLESSMKISADEQVEFLKRLYFENLGVSDRATSVVKAIMVREKETSYSISAKTGFCAGPDAPPVAWYVGFVEAHDNIYFFALNITGKDTDQLPQKRIELTKKALVELEVLPPDAL